MNLISIYFNAYDDKHISEKNSREYFPFLRRFCFNFWGIKLFYIFLWILLIKIYWQLYLAVKLLIKTLKLL